MNSLTDLREVVDVVIGVDTHVHTHSAAVIDAATGGVLDEITVEATAEGYAELVEFANNHPILRAWAIEGTGGHGAGLSRHLLEASEIVIELDRPTRAARRNGAKSDPLDAIRAAREAMARPRLGTPRTGGERQALSVLLAARRSAIHASTEAQQQVFSLVIAAPEAIRARFRGQKLAAMLNTAANMRVRSSWDVETVAVEAPLPAGLSSEPARQQPQERPGVADVDRRSTSPAQADAADSQLGRLALDGRADGPHRGEGRAGVGRVEVVAHHGHAIAHRRDDRGPVGDRLVRRRGERPAQRPVGPEPGHAPPASTTATTWPSSSRTIVEARSASSGPATQIEIAPVRMSGAG